MSTIDLHLHSHCSDDGELSPLQIVAACQSAGIKIAAITDHNSVRGVSAAKAAADGLTLLSGIELDCSHRGRGFHLLGYGFDHTRHEFDEIEEDILRQEQAASEQKIALFVRATGIPIRAEDVLAAAPDGVVTGELVAELLLARENAASYLLLRPYLPGGARCDMPNVNFYWDYFSEGKPAYVPIHYIALADAVSLIHSAGGVAVLAHPGQNLRGDDAPLGGIIGCGIDGIEAFSSYHTPKVAEHYLAVARRHRLMVTCGSDFHGKHKPNISLGAHGALWDDEKIVAQLRMI